MPVPPIFVIEEGDGTYQLMDEYSAHLVVSAYAGQTLGALSGPDGSARPEPHSVWLRHRSSPKRDDLQRFPDRPANPPKAGVHPGGGDWPGVKIRGPEISHVQAAQHGRRAAVGAATAQLYECVCWTSVFPDFLIRMSEVDDFKECTSGMTPARRLSAFDQELVLRFFALKRPARQVQA